MKHLEGGAATAAKSVEAQQQTTQVAVMARQPEHNARNTKKGSPAHELQVEAPVITAMLLTVS